MGPNQFYSGEQFAQTYTISEDPSVLPAAGAGGTAAGADFHDAAVDPFAPNDEAGAAAPEELPGIGFPSLRKRRSSPRRRRRRRRRRS